MKRIHSKKKFIVIALLIQCALFVSLCQTSVSAQDQDIGARLSVLNVSVDRKAFYPDKGEKVKVKFRISKRALVSLLLYDEGDMLTRSVSDVLCAEKGYHEISWDGKDNAGRVVSPGAYIYVISAVCGEEGEKFIYDMADETGGIELMLRDIEMDRQERSIRYIMPKAGRVRIRTGIKEGGPMLRTLIDWDLREAGRHEVTWDGFDASGTINSWEDPLLYINLSAYSLPENCVIVRGKKKQEDVAKEAGSTGIKRKKRKSMSEKHRHFYHDRKSCHEPRFSFEILGAEDYVNGIAVVTDEVSIRINIDERDLPALINSRFEIIFFIDNVFLFEEEEGTSPFTYRFNTEGLNHGEHVLTLNVASYDDHIGSVSKKVFVRKESETIADQGE